MFRLMHRRGVVASWLLGLSVFCLPGLFGRRPRDSWEEWAQRGSRPPKDQSTPMRDNTTILRNKELTEQLLDEIMIRKFSQFIQGNDEIQRY